MPRIPQYQDQGQLTTQQPAAKISSDVVTLPFDELAKTGQAVTTAGDQFRKANQVVEYTKAQNEATKRLYDMKIRYENDMDYKTMPQRYQAELDQIKKDVMKNVYDPHVQGIFGNEFNNDAMKEMLSVQQTARKRMIDDGRASGLEALDQQQKMFFLESDPVRRAEIKARGPQLIDGLVAQGFYDKEDAYKLKEAWRKDVEVQQAVNDLQSNPTLFLDALKKGVYDVNEDEKNQLETKAIAYEKTLKEQAKRDTRDNQNATYSQAFSLAVDGKLSLNDAQGLIAGSKITPAQFNILEKRILKGGGAGKTDPAAYAHVASLMAENEWEKAYEAVTDYNAAGKYSDTDYKSTLNRFGTFMPQGVGPDGKIPRPDHNESDLMSRALQGGLGVIKSMSNMFAMPAGAEDQIVGRFMAEISRQNIAPAEFMAAARSAAKLFMYELNPQLAAVDVVTIFRDAFGRRAKVYPDGKIEVIDDNNPTDADYSEAEDRESTWDTGAAE